MSNEPFIIERIYNAPIGNVWKALTDINDIRQWYFQLAEFKAEAGFEFKFNGGTEEHQYGHTCRITEVVPGKKLAYSWQYDGYEGYSVVTFELSDEGHNKTRLTLTHEGLETFPANNPDFAKSNFEMGWTDITGRSLKAFVEKD